MASAIKHPGRSGLLLLEKIDPHILWRNYERLCKKAGATEPLFILSMDCDTTEDIHVVPEVHERLMSVGVQPVYAVPGELLEEGAHVYGDLARDGVSFLNHGHRRHTSYDPSTRTYESFFFYDQQPFDVVRKDIRDGHAAVTRITGKEPTGFRTPHFGSFQKKSALSSLHRDLDGLGYRYSTSTMPFRAVQSGPVIEGPIAEVPVTGCYDSPLTILDSWSFRFEPRSDRSPLLYEEQARKLAHFLQGGANVIINLYVDPSQVYDWEGFFDVMRLFTPFACDSYDALLDRLGA